MKCKTRNYITVKYKKNLIFDKRFKCNYKTRQNINFINVRNSTILSNDSLTIEENDIIEIHFINPLASSCAGAPSLKYGDVNTVTPSPGEIKGLIMSII